MQQSRSLRYTNYSFLLTFILLFLTSQLFAQSQSVRDDIAELNLAKTEEDRLYWYNYISYDLRHEKYYDSAMTFADSALAISRRLGDQKGVATAYSRKGDVYDETADKKRAVAYYDSSYILSVSIDFVEGQARVANQLTVTLNGLGRYKKAISNGHLALALFEQEKDEDGISLALNNLADAYSSLAEYDSSIAYFNKALAKAIELSDSSDIASVYLNLGVVYKRLENYDKALELAEMSQLVAESLEEKDYELLAKAMTNQGNIYLETYKPDKAEPLFKAALDLKMNNRLANKIAPEFNGLGLVAMSKKEWSKAEDYYQQSFELSEKQGRGNAYIALLNLGLVNKKKEDPLGAIDFYSQAYKRMDSLGILKRNPDVLKSLSDLYEQIEETDVALTYSKEYGKVRREINRDLIKVGNIQEDIDEAERKLERLEADQKQQELTNSRQQVILIGIAVAAILLAIVIIIKNRNTKLKAENLEREKQQAKQNEKIDRLIKNQERDTMNAMMEGQEKERTRLAREIHDRLGGMLSVVKLNFKSVETSIEALKEKNIKQYQQANQLLDEACDEVRKIAHDMTSGVLVKFGLSAAINDLKVAVENAEELKVNITELGLEDRLDYDYEINVYRIIQELLTNTLKHAEASEINIQLFKKEQVLNIMVDDDGKGFNPEEGQEHNGLGLESIKSRVSKFDGKLEIDSGKGGGSTFTIDLPLKEKAI